MNSQMAFANPRDWCTVAYAAEQIGVSQRTVRRMIRDTTLHGFYPRHGSRESGRRHAILYVPEVAEFAKAYKKVKGPTNA